MVYNSLKPEGHIFCSSNWVLFTSTHNSEVFLRIVYLSSVQDLIALFDMVKLYLAKQICRTCLVRANLKADFQMLLKK